MQPLKRRRGPVVVLVFLSLVVIVVATALGFWFKGREPMGPVLRLVGLDDHTVVVVRRGYRQREYVHLTVRDLRTGEQRWKMALWNVLEYAEPLLRGDFVMLRVREQLGRPETQTFRLSTGQFVWRAGRVERGPRETVRGASVLGSRHLYEVTGGREAKVVAIEPADGRVVFERTLPGGEGTVHAVAAGESLALDAGDGNWRLLEGPDREPTVLGRGSACTFGQGVFFLGTTASEGGRPVRIAADVRDRRIVLCGKAGTTDVLLLSGRPGTMLLTRPAGSDLFSIVTVVRVPLVADLRSTAVIVPRTLPLLHPDGTLDVIDVGSGSQRALRLRDAARPGKVFVGTNVAAVVVGSHLIAFRSGSAAPVVAELEGEERGEVHLAVVGDVVFVARGSGIVGLDVANRSLVGISGPLGASFVEGGIDSVSTAVTR